MGKGSGRRPLLVSQEEADNNWNAIFGKNKIKKNLAESIEENVELYKQLSRMDTVGQNGNNGDHYEYELNKSTGEVEKRFKDGFEKPNGEQFGNESDTIEP